jgi:molybdate transport system substrate-binding protein
MSKKAVSLRTCVVAILSLVLVSCSSKDTSPTRQTKDSASAKNASDDEGLVFSAAASTKEVVESLGKDFTAKTGVKVKVNPGPSNGLASQIIAGAPADLFLSANQQWADEVQKSGHAHAMARLLTNRLVIIVPSDNPANVKEPKDLLSTSVKKIALAGENVPAGIYAGQALSKLGWLDELVATQKVVRGQDVRVTLSYVERGEADAGLVYSTDAALASGVKIVHEFDPTLHDEIVYVLVLLEHGSANPRAKELYEFLQSPDADATYAKFGFSRAQ